MVRRRRAARRGRRCLYVELPRARHNDARWLAARRGGGDRGQRSGLGPATEQIRQKRYSRRRQLPSHSTGRRWRDPNTGWRRVEHAQSVCRTVSPSTRVQSAMCRRLRRFFRDRVSTIWSLASWARDRSMLENVVAPGARIPRHELGVHSCAATEITAWSAPEAWRGRILIQAPQPKVESVSRPLFRVPRSADEDAPLKFDRSGVRESVVCANSRSWHYRRVGGTTFRAGAGMF